MIHLTGLDVGRYHIIEPLGEGGMAIVYKAYDTRLERDVAIKFIRTRSIPPDQLEKLLKRFEREAKRTAQFTHPNIIAIMDYGEYEGTPYLVMPYLPGGTLKDMMNIHHDKPFPYKEAARLLAPVARALEYAHKRDTIHRDVKPSNILLTDEGQPVLTDFGVAKILDLDEGQTLTGTGMGVGTPKYMAPEQWKNQVVVQTDIYELGVVLYEMVTGRVPYDAETPAEVLAKQITEQPPRPHDLNPLLPQEVEQLLDKALAKDPLKRYTDMGLFADSLERLGQAAQTEGKRVMGVTTETSIEYTSSSHRRDHKGYPYGLQENVGQVYPQGKVNKGRISDWSIGISGRIGILFVVLVVVGFVLFNRLNGNIERITIPQTENPRVMEKNITITPLPGESLSNEITPVITPSGEKPIEILKNDKLVFAWIPKALNNPVFETGKVGAEMKAKQLTEKGPVKVEILYTAPTKSDIAEQAAVIEGVIAKKVDAIGVSCNEPKGCEDPINKAVEAGIPVMTWDSDSPNSKRFTYLGVDNKEGGKAAAELMKMALPDGGKVALLTGVPGAANLEARIAGFKEGIQGSKIEVVDIVSCNDDIQKGVQVVEETMTKYPDLNGWFLVGLWPIFAGEGAMPKWEAATKKGMKSVAFDTLPVELEWVQKGMLYGLVGQKYFGWGYDTVQMIYDLIINRKKFKPFTNAGVDIVTACNVDAMSEAWKSMDFTKPLPDWKCK